MDWICELTKATISQYSNSSQLEDVSIGGQTADKPFCLPIGDANALPTIFLIIFSPITFYDLYKSQNAHLRSSSPVNIRILICFVIIIDLIISLLHSLKSFLSANDSLPYRLYAIQDAAQLVGIGLALIFLIACRNRGVVTSGVLFNFWLLRILTVGIDLNFLRKDISDRDLTYYTELHFITQCVAFIASVIQLILSSIADTPSSAYLEKKACPELYSSFLSQVTFSWFNRLMWLGNRRPLEREDLWDLNDRDRSEVLIPQFLSYLIPNIERHQRLKEYHPEVAAKNLPSVLGPIAKTFKLSLISAFFLKLCFDLMQFVSPYLLKLLIRFMEDRLTPIGYGIAIAGIMLVSAYIQSMLLHQYFHIMFRMGMNIRSVLTGAVYRKALNLSNDARKNRTIGAIVNIMAVDIQRIQEITSFIMLVWSSPLQIIIAVFFLFRELGAAVFAGLTVLVLMIPFTYAISYFIKNTQNEQMKLKDQRIKIMQEILNGMKVVKLYAWEKKMMSMVEDIRKKELVTLRKMAYLNAVTTLSWAITPFLVAILTFGFYVLGDPENNVLTPQVTFVSLALFNILRFPLAAIGMVLTQKSKFWVKSVAVSVTRLREFFAEDEIKPEEVARIESSKSDAVKLQNATFAWGAKEPNPTLTDIELTVKRGQLVAVVGRVGSGKSSLLQAILGEMNRITGERTVSGSAAYVPQQAWIRNQTLRQNILFNKPVERDFYELVIDACALRPDIAHLPGGDQTEIGEKGINLSGGQKQRISLARAIYANTDIVLLDDPLSAVDAHVGKHIFDNVISSKTGMLKEKTRVFVTHGLAFLKHCDQIIVMKDGKICEAGGYNELLSQQGVFSDLIEEFLIEEAKGRGRSVSFGEDAKDMSDILEVIDKVNPEKRKKLESQISQEIINQRRGSSVSPPVPMSPKSGESIPLIDVRNSVVSAANGQTVTEETPQNATPLKSEEKQALLGTGPAKPKIPIAKIIEKETIQTGKVDWAVYLAYFKAIGVPITAVFIGIYITSSVIGVLSNLYLARWSDNAQKIVDEDPSGHETYAKLGTYSALGVGQATTICLASVIMTLGMVRASRFLHSGILSNVLHSPMQFFDVTPLGRIINRFSKDIADIDSRLPSFIITFVGSFLQSLMILFIPIYVTPPILFFIVPTLVLYYYICDIDIVDSVLPRSVLQLSRTLISSLEIIFVIIWATPSFLVALVPLVLCYTYILKYYVATSRQLKRLESATRSPIFSHFQESIQGAASIRAYGVVNLFIQESQNRVDENMATYYPSLVANRWLAVRMEFVGNLIVFFAALFAALMRDYGSLSAGLVGLSVSYALSITQTLNWAVRMTSELETNIVAVERIKEYADLPIEGQKSHRIPPEDWPREGDIKINSVSLKYRDGLDLVLKDLNAHIKPHEKVGIVGRTGAGKSSLTLALFRIVELSGGSIEIDSEDVSSIELSELRSRLTIVPQDPVLFTGTLRMNLDPFEQFDDSEIWNALENSHLSSFVSSLQDELNYAISEGGENLSVGQRQLLCLARALLRRKTQILILDEAAAAVDVETDALLQKTIRESFKHCTVLTIAHRLNTVMDSDRMLVMDQGKAVEFDTPQNLLANKGSIFYSMAKDAGIA